MYRSLVPLLAAASYAVHPAAAQVCVGDIELRSQEPVDTFDCSAVDGYLLISGIDIVDLSPLLGLGFVGGHLIIEYTGLCTSLVGQDREVESG